MTSPSSFQMKKITLILVSWLAMSQGTQTTSLSSSLSNKWHLVKDKHHHAERNFIFTQRKPTLAARNNSNTDTASQNQAQPAAALFRTSASSDHEYSTSSKLTATSCGTKQYVVTLKHGSCSRQVVTQVWRNEYGPHSYPTVNNLVVIQL